MSALVVPAYPSQNTLLYLGGPTSPPSYVLQGRMGDIKFAGISVDVVDVSNQESDFHRMLATLGKIGDMTANFYWEPDQTQDMDLFALIYTRPAPLQQWKVVWPVPSPATYAWLFNAYLTKFAADASIAKALMAPITLTVDNGITVVST